MIALNSLTLAEHRFDEDQLLNPIPKVDYPECASEGNLMDLMDGYYWDKYACEVFEIQVCFGNCPSGWEYDPRENCRCRDGTEVYKIYQNSRGKTVPGYLLKYKEEVEQSAVVKECQIECFSDAYIDKSCNCFKIKQCDRVCGNGYELDPTQSCTCVPGNSILRYYPQGTPIPEYLEKYTEEAGGYQPKCLV